jgi:hypothetical protein
MTRPDDFTTTDTERWLLAPVFGTSEFDLTSDVATGDWSDLPDETETLQDNDGHLSELGVSVLADALAGSRDATEGLDDDLVNRAHAHVVTCASCSQRIDAIGRWSSTLKDQTASLGSESSARSDTANSVPPLSAATSTPIVAAAADNSDNVVSFQEAKSRRRFPRFLVPVAASVAALAFGSYAVLGSRVKPANQSPVAAETAAKPSPDNAAPAELSQERSAESEAGAETSVAAETTVAAASETVAAPASEAKAKKAPVAPPTTGSPADADFNVDAVKPVVPSVPAQPPQGGARDRAGIGAPVGEDNKPGETKSGVLPRLIGSFQTLEQAAARLRAVPTTAVNDREPPCRIVLERLLTEKGADPDEARFARADIAGELVTLAIVEKPDGNFEVVGADTACKPVE